MIDFGKSVSEARKMSHVARKTQAVVSRARATRKENARRLAESGELAAYIKEAEAKMIEAASKGLNKFTLNMFRTDEFTALSTVQGSSWTVFSQDYVKPRPGTAADRFKQYLEYHGLKVRVMVSSSQVHQNVNNGVVPSIYVTSETCFFEVTFYE